MAASRALGTPGRTRAAPSPAAALRAVGRGQRVAEPQAEGELEKAELLCGALTVTALRLDGLDAAFSPLLLSTSSELRLVVAAGTEIAAEDTIALGGFTPTRSHVEFSAADAQTAVVHTRRCVSTRIFALEIQLQLTRDGTVLASGFVPWSSIVNLTPTPVRSAVHLKPSGAEYAIPTAKHLLLRLELRFVRFFGGILSITLHRAQGLRKSDVFGKGDPYIRVTLGEQVHCSVVHTNAGTDPSFDEEQLSLWVPLESHLDSVLVEAMDQDKYSADDVVGFAHLQLADVGSSFHTMEHALQLHARVGKHGALQDAGKLFFSSILYPAGDLQLKVLSARYLLCEDALNQDPYVTLTLPGLVHSHKAKTIVDSKGGDTPIWNQSFHFVVVDHHAVKLAVYDHDLLTVDDLIGEVTLDLSQVYRLGVRDDWITIKRRNHWGQLLDAGEVNIQAMFEAPPGFAYPMLRDSMRAYDERERRAVVRNARLPQLPLDVEAPVTATAAEPPHVRAPLPVLQTKSKRDTEERGKGEDDFDDDKFTDDEIAQAFDRLDLDQNNLVGFHELRHMLVCMGELVTTEEVDEMMRLVDGDGDGMASFFELYAVAKHPNPAAPRFNAKRIREKLKARVAAGELQIGSRFEHVRAPAPASRDATGATPLKQVRSVGLMDIMTPRTDTKKTGVDVEAATALRQKKAAACIAFMRAHNFRLPQLRRMFEDVRHLPLYARTGGYFSLVQLCAMLGVQPVEPEARALFAAFVTSDDVDKPEAVGQVNCREVLLALAAFAGVDANARARFTFELFDDNNTNTLSTSELVAVLRANHMAGNDEAARRKVNTVLTQTERTGEAADVEITFAQFLELAHKFPNLIFPRLQGSSETSGVGGAAAAAGSTDTLSAVASPSLRAVSVKSPTLASLKPVSSPELTPPADSPALPGITMGPEAPREPPQPQSQSQPHARRAWSESPMASPTAGAGTAPPPPPGAAPPPPTAPPPRATSVRK